MFRDKQSQEHDEGMSGIRNFIKLSPRLQSLWKEAVLLESKYTNNKTDNHGTERIP